MCLGWIWLVVVVANLALVGQVLLPWTKTPPGNGSEPCLGPRALGSPRLSPSGSNRTTTFGYESVGNRTSITARKGSPPPSGITRRLATALRLLESQRNELGFQAYILCGSTDAIGSGYPVNG
jgi:hypothetical protein